MQVARGTGTQLRDARAGRHQCESAHRSNEPDPHPLQNSRTFRTASTTRSTDGMYASSICQYGYGTS